MRVLGIIPARAGSKGVKDKNVRQVAGQPLIAYSIEAARQSKKLTQTIVSTDGEEIKAVALAHGAEVLMRPGDLARDHSPVTSVVFHVLTTLGMENRSFDLVVLLQPTAPIRTGLDIDNVISLFEQDAEVDGVISVVPMHDMHPARMYNLDSGAWMVPFLPEGETCRRQDLAPVYYRNGCIYAVRTEAFLREQSLIVKKKKAYIMALDELVNIDDERDLLIADVLVKLWKERQAAL